MRRRQLIRQLELAILGLTRITPGITEALGYLLAGAGLSESIAWLNSLLLCIGFLVAGNEAEAAICFSKLYGEARIEGPVRRRLERVIQLLEGRTTMASAVAPVPTITYACPTPLAGTDRGICCAAVTQLGLTRASQGFQYTDCKGRTRCLACGTKASTSKKHPGQTVFAVKRISCGPSGCPALGTVQGNIVAPL